MQRADVAIIGGGPGGSSTAAFLADRGVSVALFERETFPRFHVGESLMPATMLLLQDLGVRHEIDAHGFQLKYGAAFINEENGDTQTMETFSSMALLAYAQLDTVDADARYHAALLRVHTGDTAGALALADSIEAEVPTHLFGSVVRGMVARFGGDQAGLKAAEAKFLRNWDAEMAAGRREYGEHRGMLDEFRQRAGAGS